MCSRGNLIITVAQPAFWLGTKVDVANKEKKQPVLHICEGGIVLLEERNP
jgi:hypothetical protein